MQLETLSDAERYLDGLINREKKTQYDYERLGLAPIRALLAEIGSPERELPCVHVAGSKGKGTTTLASECLLRAAGARVGTYTSPHLESWRERFRIDGVPVAEREPIDGCADPSAIERLRTDPELCPSFFDASTALALYLFRAARVEVGAIEVGLGGRLDSTNAVQARVSVVTAIQLEHTDKLGKTLEAIAREKAGIFRAGAPALHGPLAPEAWGPRGAGDRGRHVLESRRARRARERVGPALPARRRPRARGAACSARTRPRTSRAAPRGVFLGRALRRELAALGSLELPGVSNAWATQSSTTPTPRLGARAARRSSSSGRARAACSCCRCRATRT
jgi:hypothetical protein